MLRVSKTLLIVVLLFVGTASAADLVTIKPTLLEFGKVPQGSVKTLNLRLKTSASLGAAIKLVTASPFLVDRTSFAMQKMAFSEVVVTLPSTVALGEYTGKLELQVSPVDIGTSSVEKIEVSLHATVVPDIPDFSVNAQVESCKKDGKFLSCNIQVFPITTSAAPFSVRATISHATNEKDEVPGLDRVLDFQPKPGTAFIYEASKISSKADEITLRIAMDPENQVPESNEENNTQSIVLNISDALKR